MTYAEGFNDFMRNARHRRAGPQEHPSYPEDYNRGLRDARNALNRGDFGLLDQYGLYRSETLPR